MEAKDIEVIANECEAYFETMENTYPNIVLSTFDIDSLTLGVLFRKHPAQVGEINKEVIDKVSKDELYSVFREQVLEKAKAENWFWTLETEKLRQVSSQKVSRNITFKPELMTKMLERNEEVKRQIAIFNSSSPEAQYYKEAMRLNYKFGKAAERLMGVWRAFIDYKKRKKINK